MSELTPEKLAERLREGAAAFREHVSAASDWPDILDEAARKLSLPTGTVSVPVAAFVRLSKALGHPPQVDTERDTVEEALIDEAVQKLAQPTRGRRFYDSLPDWNFCNQHDKAGTANALEKFISEQEPTGTEQEQRFRAGLLAVLNQVHADLLAPPPNDDSSLNAPWLSIAHAVCAEARIAPGHIYERLQALGDKVQAWRAAEPEGIRALAYRLHLRDCHKAEDGTHPFCDDCRALNYGKPVVETGESNAD